MTDITAPTVGRRRPGSVDASVETSNGSRPDANLVQVVELLFFAYRDFTGEADAILAEIGFGRAHHRVLHFVSRNPGLRVADLLGILKITKQSLARVLKQLVDQGYILQSAGERDRRERRLTLTEKGEALAARLVALQARRIAEALAVAGPAAQENVRHFLFAMIGEGDRHGVAALLGTSELTF
jgi:DNA-binding MarR family transcriptional regulator